MRNGFIRKRYDILTMPKIIFGMIICTYLPFSVRTTSQTTKILRANCAKLNLLVGDNNNDFILIFFCRGSGREELFQ